MKKILSFLLIVLLMLPAGPVQGWGEELKEAELYAKAACLMDGDSGRVLYGKNNTEKLPMASTTKIVTCILALEKGHADDVVTASAYAASQPKVKMDVKEGEQFLLNDLLYGLMLNSYNDAAVMIAEHIGGSVENFAEMMNLKAREAGCTDTYFITPNGLDAEDEYGTHSTTADDLARLLRYCILESPQKDMYLEITGTLSYTFWNVAATRNIQCTNHNAFLGMMDGALTGKTGFTNQAGYCYTGALAYDGKIFIVSLLACGWPGNKGYKWADTKKLMMYGLKNYEYKDVFDRKELGYVSVKEGYTGQTGLTKQARIPLCYGTDMEKMSMVVLMKEDDILEVVYKIPESVQAPVRKGQQLGKVRYVLNGEIIKEIPVYAREKSDKISYPWCLKQIGRIYMI